MKSAQAYSSTEETAKSVGSTLEARQFPERVSGYWIESGCRGKARAW